MNWELTHEEFKVLCNRYLDGWLPPPLTYSSRIPTFDAYESELSRVEAELRDRLDAGLNIPFDTLANPEVFVVLGSWCDSDFENPAKQVRIHAARRGWHAVMVIQHMGETIYHSTGYTLIECDPDALSMLMVGELPDTVAASGSPLPMVFDPPERDPYEIRQSVAFDSFDDTLEVRSRAFWSRTAERSGVIRVVQGRSIYGPRGRLMTSAFWRDVVGEGRYLIEVDESDTRAMGADSTMLAQSIDRRTALVLEHMEERGELRV
ncbi:ESX secretion-associated protein EspG [Nocardia sp. NPDC005746]|uniref:ESX secretion-associated protein EspG n=1 Tax=Nocardia sp. NPDC005746 TaxID=3157062 RepID=UPI0033F650B6